jgi:hypothetical protein
VTTGDHQLIQWVTLTVNSNRLVDHWLMIAGVLAVVIIESADECRERAVVELAVKVCQQIQLLVHIINSAFASTTTPIAGQSALNQLFGDHSVTVAIVAIGGGHAFAPQTHESLQLSDHFRHAVVLSVEVVVAVDAEQ